MPSRCERRSASAVGSVGYTGSGHGAHQVRHGAPRSSQSSVWTIGLVYAWLRFGYNPAERVALLNVAGGEADEVTLREMDKDVGALASGGHIWILFKFWALDGVGKWVTRRRFVMMATLTSPLVTIRVVIPSVAILSPGSDSAAQIPHQTSITAAVGQLALCERVGRLDSNAICYGP